MRALQARGAQVTAEEQEIMDQLELALKETDASDDKVGGVKRLDAAAGPRPGRSGKAVQG